MLVAMVLSRCDSSLNHARATKCLPSALFQLAVRVPLQFFLLSQSLIVVRSGCIPNQSPAFFPIPGGRTASQMLGRSQQTLPLTSCLVRIGRTFPLSPLQVPNPASENFVPFFRRDTPAGLCLVLAF